MGQRHLLGPKGSLRSLVDKSQCLPSLLLWGPPGTGKTTLASLLASRFGHDFVQLSAVTAGLKDIREVVERAELLQNRSGRSLVMFLDEIHRFNKTQQDGLLPHVESGLLTLIGATTENPRFSVNRALLSRTHVYGLRPLEIGDLSELLDQALADQQRGLGALEVRLEPSARQILLQGCAGDARTLLNRLEMAVVSAPYGSDGSTVVTQASLTECLGENLSGLGKSGDNHYNLTSAWIKSMRGSDPDASLYWLARLVVSGEDLSFLCRRLMIAAAEDVGLADPNSLLVCQNCVSAAEYVGLPEARYHLAMATIYLACAPKSDSLKAFFAAEQLAQATPELDPPPHLMPNHPSYQNPHVHNSQFQSHWPSSLKPQQLFQPGQLGWEQKIWHKLQKDKDNN